jgi:hypothetical protein
MSTPSAYSERNVANSVAAYLADCLLGAGYLVYWHQIDAVQAPSGWYHRYSAEQAAYLADATFAAEVAAAAGLITVRGDISALPRFVTRRTVDGSVAADQEYVPVPALSIAVGPAQADRRYELGTALKWRERHLFLVVLARDGAEQSTLQDALGVWLDGDTVVAVLDHAAGTAAPVGDVRVARVAVERATVADDAEALTYQVALNALLEYVA